jgi:hypothetical protein
VWASGGELAEVLVGVALGFAWVLPAVTVKRNATWDDALAAVIECPPRASVSGSVTVVPNPPFESAETSDSTTGSDCTVTVTTSPGANPAPAITTVAPGLIDEPSK